jgi:hypothetical protein
LVAASGATLPSVITGLDHRVGHLVSMITEHTNDSI